VRITHEFVETLTEVPRSYLIRDLYHPHVIHESIVDVVLSSHTARVCSGAVTGLSALGAAAGSQLLHSPHATVVATVTAIAAAVLAMRGWQQWRRPRGLWVYHQGQPVCLFVSRDRLLFGQVTRALLRAFEGEAY
jgi:hypothetical protein